MIISKDMAGGDANWEVIGLKTSNMSAGIIWDFIEVMWKLELEDEDAHFEEIPFCRCIRISECKCDDATELIRM